MTKLRAAGPTLVFLASAAMMLASVLAGVKLHTPDEGVIHASQANRVERRRCLRIREKSDIN
jgi:hypothetical protein